MLHEEAVKTPQRRQPKASTGGTQNPLDNPWERLRERPGIKVLEETRRTPGRP
jgi:hypothetical protein